MATLYTAGAWHHQVVRALLGLTATALACRSPGSAPTAAPATAESAPARDAAVDAPLAPPRVVCAPPTQPAYLPWPTRGAACVDAAGRRQGPAVWLDPAGGVVVRGTYRDDQPDGPWRMVAPSGSAVEGHLRAGRPDGTWRQWLAGGWREVGALVDGTGTLTLHHDAGSIATVTSYRDGLRDGPATRYLPSGQLLVSEHWRADRRDGARTIGTAKTIGLADAWRAGHRIGALVIYRRGRRELEAGHDGAGRLDGPWTASREGRPRERGAYRAGQRIGPWTWFDARGETTRLGSYRAGVRDGEWTEWTAGSRTRTERYRRGRLDDLVVSYDGRGAELGRDTLTDGTGVVRTFHRNRRPATETTLRRGVPHGPYRALSVRGRPLVVGQHEDGARVGTWRSYDASGALTGEETWRDGRRDGRLARWRDGVLLLEADYQDGVRAGRYAEYFADGRPAVVGQYHDDLRIGAWQTYRADGTLALRATYAAGVLDGPWQELDASGAVVVTGQHVGGHRTGRWRQRTATGEVEVDHGTPDLPLR
jgi:antitoxin component YwqK of YwqJK toxin-antitoxin module